MIVSVLVIVIVNWGVEGVMLFIGMVLLKILFEILVVLDVDGFVKKIE